MKKKKKANMIKDRTWHLKSKWYDKTVDYICKEFSALTYCQSIRTLAVAGISGYIALFDSIGTCFNIFFAHTDTITKMIWLDDSKQLVSTGLDGAIKIWNLYHSKYTNIDNSIKNVLKDSIDYSIPNNIENNDKLQQQQQQQKQQELDSMHSNNHNKNNTNNNNIIHNDTLPPPQSNVQYLNKSKARTPEAIPQKKYKKEQGMLS